MQYKSEVGAGDIGCAYSEHVCFIGELWQQNLEEEGVNYFSQDGFEIVCSGDT